LKFSRDSEMSEGPDPRLGVQIDTVEDHRCRKALP
jgi:hypothetical protein